MGVLQREYFDGHTYLLLDNPTDTKWWNGDEAEAVSLGGHLANIGSAAEDVFAINTFAQAARTAAFALPQAGPIWIFFGLSDQAAEGTFVWANGDPLTYTHWQPGQPNLDPIPDEDFACYSLTFNQPGSWYTIPGDNRFGDRAFGLAELPFMQGTSSTDFLVGSAGDDLIYGGAGKDGLNGDAGNDYLLGGTGKDKMFGGAGNDVFDFDARNETGKTASTRDVIGDFKHKQDHIDLKDIDANAKKHGDQAFKFIGSQDFHHVKGELHYFSIVKSGDFADHKNGSVTNRDKVIIEGDINGDGKADFQIELSHYTTIAKSDFVL
jgi:hypothetical protein